MRSLLWIKHLSKVPQCSLNSTKQIIPGSFSILSCHKRMLNGGTGHGPGISSHKPAPGHEPDNKHKTEGEDDHAHAHGHGDSDHEHHEHQDGQGPDYTPKLWTKSDDHHESHESHGSEKDYWDPNYVPCTESDFDCDPMDVRLREPLPKEIFMPREMVLARVIKLCQSMKRANTDGKTITEDTHLANDLGLDSLDQVEFGLALEDEFDIEIPDEEAEQVVTVGDAVELIADHPHVR